MIIRSITLLAATLLLVCATISSADTGKARELVVNGIRHFKSDKFPEARVAFEQAIAIDPKYSRAYAARGYIDGIYGAYNAWANDIRTAIELAPGDATYWCELGKIYFNKSPLPMHKEAIEAYTKAIELDPTFAVPYRYRGQVYRQIGEKEAAERDFEAERKLTGNRKEKSGGCLPWFNSVNP